MSLGVLDFSYGNVAMHLRDGGIFYYCFTTNLLLSFLVKERWKLVSIWQSWRQEYSGTFFPDKVY